jgi:radical SAM superfamily enzyme YgiQ (UPF0313 family)
MNISSEPAPKRPGITFIAFYDEVALGIRTLHSVLTREGFPCNLIFFQSWGQPSRYPTENEMQLLYDLIEKDESMIFGISFRSIVFHLAKRVTEEIRGIKGDDVKILWGGSHSTILPEECMKHADVVCVGEGEEAIVEFMDAIDFGRDYSDIKNLWVNTESGVKQNPIRPLIQDLDSVPWPVFGDEGKSAVIVDRVINGDPKYIMSDVASYFIISSRGCPFSCDFCCNSALRKIYKGAGAYVRKRSPENVIAELEYAKENLDLVYVAFMDELFTMDIKWTREVCSLYSEKINLPFTCEVHPDTIDEEMAGVLGRAGVCSVVIGVQSGSERTRDEVFNRKVSNKQVLESARLLHDIGAIAHYDFILDNPYETKEDLAEAFQLLLELPRPTSLEIFSLRFFPRTNITERALNDGIINEEDIEGVVEKPFRSYLHQFHESLNHDNAFYSMLFYLSQLKFSFRRMEFHYFIISDEPNPYHVFSVDLLRSMEKSQWFYKDPERLYKIHRFFIVHMNRVLSPLKRIKTAVGLLLKGEFKEISSRMKSASGK